MQGFKIIFIMRQLIFFIGLIYFSSCDLIFERPAEKEVPFYKKKVIIGRGVNIPLIKPYSAIENEDIRVWTIDLLNKEPTRHNENLHTKIAILDSLNVIDSIIIAKCSNEYCSFGGEEKKEIYYLIMPSQRIEKAFFSYKEFIDAFSLISKKYPTFNSAYDVYSKWKNEDVLLWGKIDSVYERKIDN